MYSKTLLLFLVVQLIIIKCSLAQKNEHFFRKDYVYFEATRSFYKTHSIAKTIFEAKKICTNENAQLWVVEDHNEANVILHHLSKTYDSVLVGISDLVANEVYETTDGRSISEVYSKWAAKEPNKSDGHENCVELRSTGELNDIPCSRKMPFICKKKSDSLTWNKKCNMSYLDFSYNETLDKCYKFHFNPLSWTDAHEMCAAEQSYLAVINSQSEADYFVQLIEDYNRNKSGDCASKQVFLGFHNKLNEGWTTVRGKSLEENGYYNWSPGRPDDGEVGKCGAMVYDGHLNDIACHKRSAFICEHEIDRPNIKDTGSTDALLGYVLKNKENMMHTTTYDPNDSSYDY